MTAPYTGSPRSTSQARNSRRLPSPGGGESVAIRSGTRYIPAVTSSPALPPRRVTRPAPSRTAQSGRSSATKGVTPSTSASGGNRRAASTNPTKSRSGHQASTVEISARTGPRRRVISRKLSREERVVFTMNRRERSGNRARTQSAQSRSCSFRMIASDRMPAAVKFRITPSIRGAPATGTMGFGTVHPASRRRLPAPAARMPPYPIGAPLTGLTSPLSLLTSSPVRAPQGGGAPLRVL